MLERAQLAAQAVGGPTRRSPPRETAIDATSTRVDAANRRPPLVRRARLRLPPPQAPPVYVVARSRRSSTTTFGPSRSLAFVSTPPLPFPNRGSHGAATLLSAPPRPDSHIALIARQRSDLVPSARVLAPKVPAQPVCGLVTSVLFFNCVEPRPNRQSMRSSMELADVTDDQALRRTTAPRSARHFSACYAPAPIEW